MNTITQHPIWSDPQIDLATDKTSKLISDITNEVCHWENMPNRQEPLTVDMIQHAALQCNGATPHDINNVMYDWSILAIYIGPHLAKWAQHDNGKIIMNKFGNVRAFTWDDVEFQGENNRQMSTATAFAKPYLVHTAKLTWCEQKNGQNGESHTLVRAPANPTLCPVSALFRIME